MVRALASDQLPPHGAAQCMEAHWIGLMKASLWAPDHDRAPRRHRALPLELAQDRSLSWERRCRARDSLRQNQYLMNFTTYCRWHMEKVSIRYFEGVLKYPRRHASDHHKPGWDTQTWLPPDAAYVPCQLTGKRQEEPSSKWVLATKSCIDYLASRSGGVH